MAPKKRRSLWGVKAFNSLQLFICIELYGFCQVFQGGDIVVSGEGIPSCTTWTGADSLSGKKAWDVVAELLAVDWVN